MKKNVISTSKEFAKVAKSAKVELKNTFSSVYVIVNLLNKACKGEFNKLENVSFSCDDLKRVAATLKSMHGKRYAFDIPALLQLAGGLFYYRNGVICQTAKSKSCPKFGLDLIDVTHEFWYYSKPVVLTIDAVFAAFCKVARYELKATEKAAKDTKSYEKMYNSVVSVFGAEYVATLSKDDVISKFNTIKNAAKK